MLEQGGGEGGGGQNVPEWLTAGDDILPSGTGVGLGRGTGKVKQARTGVGTGAGGQDLNITLDSLLSIEGESGSEDPLSDELDSNPNGTPNAISTPNATSRQQLNMMYTSPATPDLTLTPSTTSTAAAAAAATAVRSKSSSDRGRKYTRVADIGYGVGGTEVVSVMQWMERLGLPLVVGGEEREEGRDRSSSSSSGSDGSGDDMRLDRLQFSDGVQLCLLVQKLERCEVDCVLRTSTLLMYFMYALE